MLIPNRNGCIKHISHYLVGMVAERHRFGPGYKLKVSSLDSISVKLPLQGLLYGGPGNLSDGSSLVTGHWGPKFATGDNVGMKVP